MDDRTAGALLLAVGGISLRLGLTDASLSYIKPSLRVPLIIAGAMLVGLGGVQVIQAFRRSAPIEPEADLRVWDEHHSDHDAGHADATGHSDHGHTHAGGPRVAWLLALPLLALLLIAPPPLGAFAASRQSDAPSEVIATFPPLPEATNGAVELRVSDYVYRALYDDKESLSDQPVRLVGFVTPAEQGDGGVFRLTRFQVSCCAADGQALNVAVVSDQPAPAVEQWIELEGTWVPRKGHKVGEYTLKPPLISATAIRPIEQPKQPYEY